MVHPERDRGEWMAFVELLDMCAARARAAGATEVAVEQTGDRAALRIHFQEADRADLTLEGERPGISFEAGFGAAVSLSDYAIDTEWLGGLCDAIAAGGWTEEIWAGCDGRVARSKAVIEVDGRATVFDGSVGLGRRFRAAHFRELRYRAWEPS